MGEASLQLVLQSKAELTKASRYSILRQVAEALDAAHRRRTIHGHLSPASITLREEFVDGESVDQNPSVTVRDFGSRFDLDKEIANTDVVPESARYVSPERVLGIDLDARSDEFSLAAIAFELVCGKQPFEAGELSPLFFQICSERQKAIDQIDTALTAEVDAVFERGLAKEREQRYQSCGEFVDALGRALVKSPGWEEIVLPAAGRPAPVREAPRVETALRATAPIPAIPPRREPEYALPPLRRRRRIDEEEAAIEGGSPTKKIAVFALVGLLLAAAGFYFFVKPRPNLPVQVLDSNAGTSTPPPSEQAPPAATAPNDAKSQNASVPPNGVSPNADLQAEKTKEPPATVPAPAAPPPDTKAPTAAAQQGPTAPGPNADDSQAGAAPSTRAPQQPRQYRDEGVSSEGGTASVDLLTEPPGAKLAIDSGSTACTAPCTLRLINGRHTLTAETPGYAMAQRVFTVPDESTLYISLQKRTGALVVTSNPSSATIQIDGKNAGLTPATLHLTPGQHAVRLVNGSQHFDTSVNVVADGIQATGYTFAK